MAVSIQLFSLALRALSSAANRVHLLKEATAELAFFAKQARMGLGFDRHLYSLKCMAEEKRLSLGLFEDPAYSDLNHLVLYPSTIDKGHLERMDQLS